MLNLKNVSISHGANPLVEKINFSVYPKQIIGLVGENGCGKSSLLSILRENQEPHEGEIEYKRGTEVVSLLQEIEETSESAINYVISGLPHIYHIYQNLAHAEEVNDYDLMMKCHQALSDCDGYKVESDAAKILNGLGFTEEQMKLPVKAFSGGWRMRLSLARCLLAPSDLLLLDEPTNHLDMEAIIWLENYLKHYQGGVILVSHDRDFLDEVTTHIAHIENKNLKLYKGNYSSFELDRANAILLINAIHRKQQQARDHMMKYVERFRYKASKAKQAQSRLKAIEKMVLVDPIYEKNAFNFSFLKPEKMPNPMVTMDKVKLGYDEKIIIDKFNLSIRAGERIGLLGVNGAGKSTLIKGLFGTLKPLSGASELFPGTQVGYFAQHQVDNLDLEATALILLRRLSPTKAEKELIQYLAKFGFSRDQSLTEVKRFSGGEKSRLALALMIWQKPNLLLLDEPTNHLDMSMRKALTDALQEFEGALILVSHDRYLLRTLVDELYLIDQNKLTRFDGTVDDYRRLAS